MTAAPLKLDRELFAKCQALAARGATAGEREAAQGAAARVAASAGLTMEEAESLISGGPDRSSHPEQRPPASPFAQSPQQSYRWRTPKPEPEPVSLAEMTAQKAADVEWRKRAAARQGQKDRRDYAEQEKLNALVREQQAVRDREWAEACARRDR